MSKSFAGKFPMNLFQGMMHFFCRFKHPVSMPEEIAQDLGLNQLQNEISFKTCICSLTNPNCKPKNLWRFMKRDEAESQFHCALKKERFRSNSLFSYYLFHGWFSFDLIFDEKNRLRRVYCQHEKFSKSLNDRLEITLQD